jgi:hypothetical protein
MSRPNQEHLSTTVYKFSEFSSILHFLAAVDGYSKRIDNVNPRAWSIIATVNSHGAQLFN